MSIYCQLNLTNTRQRARVVLAIAMNTHGLSCLSFICMIYCLVSPSILWSSLYHVIALYQVRRCGCPALCSTLFLSLCFTPLSISTLFTFPTVHLTMFTFLCSPPSVHLPLFASLYSPPLLLLFTFPSVLFLISFSFTLSHHPSFTPFPSFLSFLYFTLSFTFFTFTHPYLTPTTFLPSRHNT
jgi:hypothetical protein